MDGKAETGLLGAGTGDLKDDVETNELAVLAVTAEDESAMEEQAEELAAEVTEEAGEEDPHEAEPPEEATLLPNDEEDEEATGTEEPNMELEELYSGRIFERYAIEIQPVPELNVILYHP